MRRFTTIFLAVFLTGIAIAQEKELRETDNFTAISVSSGIDLYYTQSTETKVEVVCKKDDLHRLKTEVEGNTLKVYMRGSNSWKWNDRNVPKVYVSSPHLKNLMSSGGADVYGQNMVNELIMKISSSGGADIYIEVRCEELKISTSGGSDIKIKGTADRLFATSSGGSDLNARELKAKSVKVTSSGGSDAIVWADNEITANASGGSDIVYYGNPEHKNLNESGAGDITHR
ncbi:MAG: DUF2807 domain-containing protein [Carboxylicivirga sp.]|jgi:hypothetical protein|nr:DUF2807 domain-containing protein [Carboxylicivirga sp.]